jgi:bifunctional DNase/RNase
MRIAVAGWSIAALLLASGGCRGTPEPDVESGLRPVVVEGVRIDLGGEPVVTLLEVGGQLRRLPIWIGKDQAESIHVALSQIPLPRPNTHDLMVGMLGGLGRKLERIAITELRESTYYARIELSGDGSAIDLDARPSDAIALAVRTGAQILVAEDVLARGHPGGDTGSGMHIDWNPGARALSLPLCAAHQSRSENGV